MDLVSYIGTVQLMYMCTVLNGWCFLCWFTGTFADSAERQNWPDQDGHQGGEV